MDESIIHSDTLWVIYRKALSGEMTSGFLLGKVIVLNQQRRTFKTRINKGLKKETKGINILFRQGAFLSCFMEYNTDKLNSEFN